MLGDDMVVAPVLDRNTTEWTIDLPHGNWKHLWCVNQGTLSCPVLRGPQSIKVKTEVGFPPVYYRPESRFVTDFANIGVYYGVLPCNVPFEQDINPFDFDL